MTILMYTYLYLTLRIVTATPNYLAELSQFKLDLPMSTLKVNSCETGSRLNASLCLNGIRGVVGIASRTRRGEKGAFHVETEDDGVMLCV